MSSKTNVAVSLVIFFAIRVALGSGEITGGTRVDLKYGAPLSLQGYDGPNIDIIVREREMSIVKFSVRDHEHPVASVNVTGLGETPVNFSPTVNNHALTLEMRNAIPVSNTQSRVAYLMYKCANLEVYWFDAIDTRMNSCALLIVPVANGKK